MQSGLIYNANLVLPDRICRGSLAVLGGQIGRVEADNEALPPAGKIKSNFGPGPGPESPACWEVDLQGDYLIPGLLDTHVHGCGCFAVMDGENSVDSLRKSLLQQGTTAFLPTTMSCAPEKLARVLQDIDAVCSRGKKGKDERGTAGAEIIGVHLEGPFINPGNLGAQAWVQPEGEDLRWFWDLMGRYPGLVRILTLAPERVEAGKLINFCVDNNIIPSAGHTSAGYELMQRWVGPQVNHVTHLFNAMAGIHHRAPGLATKALLDPGMWVEIIADGVHIHPGIIELVLRLKPAQSVCLVSDGIGEFSPGTYTGQGRITSFDSGVARLPDGTIAGGACSLLTGVKTLVEKLGVPLNRAVNYASINPARLLGVEGRLGSIEPGKEATFVRLSREFDVKQVWFKGRPV
ncbi:MAG TPA: N-acetylglucosamine-6-phosphate deacetylase [Verrucomicrobiae bacterium]|nr:N-acetylglucosamine-6-phosphate deacetylase [Verrucomicrobiae bacterium]